MIIINNVLVSDDLFDSQFCCDLSQCKGMCCVEGDTGAPVDPEESPSSISRGSRLLSVYDIRSVLFETRSITVSSMSFALISIDCCMMKLPLV